MQCGTMKSGKRAKEMLIVLGPGNCGKSTVIKLAYQSILQRTLWKSVPIKATYLYSTVREVAVHLTIQKSFGIATRGDGPSHVLQSLNFFKTHKCKVIVCATRSRGGSLQAAQQFAKSNGFAVTMMRKSKVPAPQQRGADSRFVKQVYKWACRSLGI